MMCLQASVGLDDSLHSSRFEIKELVLNVFSHVEEDKAYPNRICFYDETMFLARMHICVYMCVRACMLGGLRTRLEELMVAGANSL
jgi:hypothetical protein